MLLTCVIVGGGEGGITYRCSEKILTGYEPFLAHKLVVMGCSHLLAKGCDVSGGFDNALTAGLMLVQFVAEGLKD